MSPNFSSAHQPLGDEDLPTPWYEEIDPSEGGVSDEDLAVVARTLKGSALEQLITESILMGDVRMLKALKEAQVFSAPFMIDANGVEGVSGLSKAFQPIFMVLGEALNVDRAWEVEHKQPLTQQAWGANDRKNENIFRGGVRQLHLAAGVKDFLRDLCADTVRMLTQNAALAAPAAPAAEQSHPLKAQSAQSPDPRALSTLNALGCLACALDDVSMLEMILSCPLIKGPKDAMMMDSFTYFEDGQENSPVALSNLKMGGYSALFNSHQTMARLLSWDPDLWQSGMGQYIPSDDGNGSSIAYKRMSLTELWKFVDNQVPTPEFARVVAHELMGRMARDQELKKFAAEDPFWLSSRTNIHQAPAGAEVLQKLLQYSLLNSWPHLIPVCWEAGLYRINPSESIRTASTYAVKPLLVAQREDFRFDLHAPSPEGSWFKETHPLWGLLCTTPRRGSTYEDRDECLLLIFQEMDKKGVLLDQLGFASDGGLTCAGYLVELGHSQSLAYVLSRGARLGECSGHVKQKLTLEQLAVKTGREDLAAMIRSTAAKRVADAALDELGSTARRTTPGFS